MARESLIPFAPLYPDEAKAALDTIDQFRVVDMPGSPQFGAISRPWIREFVASVFGAYDTETGCRLIREWFLLISKKNTKSTSAGLLMLTFLVLNWRAAGEFGILAPTVEVANNAFKPAADAIKADPELSALLHVQDHIRTITHRTSKATLQVVAADSETVAGKKWIVTLVDELWLFGKKPNAENMLREATGGLASRDEGCVIYLSTQSDDPPAGVFKQKLQYARDVRDGRVVDPQFCPVLYEFPPSMVKAGDDRKPENFYVTNPNLGASVSESFLVREFAKAEVAGEASIRGFLAKHLNVEIGLALMSDRWAGADNWERNGDPLLTLDALLNRSEVVTVGIDAGGSDDMTALFVLGRESDTGRWLGWCHCWLKASALDLRKAEAARMRDFEADGDLTITEDLAQQVKAIGVLVERIDATGLLPAKGIGADPARMDAILNELNAVGIPDERIEAVRQNWMLMGPIIACDRKLNEGVFKHAAQSIMAWAVSNARVEVSKNAFAITKQASGAAKIDPLMAMFDAAALMARNPEAAASYVTGELIVV